MRAEDLKSIRKSKNLTVYDMAERAGLVHTTISRIENGKCGFSLASIGRVASAYGVDVAQLMEIQKRLDRRRKVSVGL